MAEKKAKNEEMRTLANTSWAKAIIAKSEENEKNTKESSGISDRMFYEEAVEDHSSLYDARLLYTDTYPKFDPVNGINPFDIPLTV